MKGSPRQPSDHFDGTRFHNLGGVAPPSFAKVARMLRTKRKPWPSHVEVRQKKPPGLSRPHEVAVTFIGHSTFLIQSQGIAILVDPVYSDRAGPFGLLGPRRVRLPGIAFGDLPRITAVLLSHNHYDHCDLPTLRKLRSVCDPVFVTPLGNSRVLNKTGTRRIEELDWWETAEVGGVKVTVTPSQHFSARTPWDRNRALWGGFALDLAGKRVYFAGDTGYMPLFGEIRRRVGVIDVALLPIGAYEPRWFMKPLHMNPGEAAQAFLDLGSPLSIASHFGTFRLTAEGIDDPVTDLAAALDQHGIDPDRFRVLEVGESISF
jgi:L-ascorbate metabolism protein UlaG (beta-lactamase superfamily)